MICSTVVKQSHTHTQRKRPLPHRLAELRHGCDLVREAYVGLAGNAAGGAEVNKMLWSWNSKLIRGP